MKRKLRSPIYRTGISRKNARSIVLRKILRAYRDVPTVISCTVKMDVTDASSTLALIERQLKYLAR